MSPLAIRMRCRMSLSASPRSATLSNQTVEAQSSYRNAKRLLDGPRKGQSPLERRSKTRIKSFRLEESIVEGLARASKRAQMTETAFLNSMMESRLMVDPLVPAFQEISFHAETFKSILAVADVDALEVAASAVALKSTPLVYELFEGTGQTLRFQEFVADILGKHGHWFNVEGNVKLTHGWVTLRHEYGLKWSKFLAGYLASAHNTFSIEKLEVRLGEQFVRISFRSDQSKDSDSQWRNSNES